MSDAADAVEAARRGAALIAAGLLVLTPLIGMAANPVFSDLGDAAAVHQPNIQAIGDAGITTGFEDPAHPGQRLYNPKGIVTREEMASFLARTAGLGGNTPVVNAQTAISAQTATSATTATHAATADTATSAQTVQDGAIGPTKISPAGSRAGQILTSTGGNVIWSNATSGDAGTLNGYPANALIRVSSLTNDGPRIGTTPTTLGYDTNELPGQGLVQVTATVELVVQTAGCPCNVSFVLTTSGLVQGRGKACGVSDTAVGPCRST